MIRTQTPQSRESYDSPVADDVTREPRQGTTSYRSLQGREKTVQPPAPRMAQTLLELGRVSVSPSRGSS